MRRTLLAVGFALLAATTQAQSNQPVEITASQMEVQHTQGTATFTGNVVVTQGNLTLTAPQLTVSYQSQSGDVDTIRTTGLTTITRSGATSEKATGTQAIYTPASQLLVLTGQVMLQRGPSQLSGDKLVYNIATGNAKVTNSSGPVKARFVPQTSN
ncbi:MAG: lipopolysaccharide transport periplasmic protein LptA [Proteobacteria bacterium]|nr:lipopolysaccharide transport periplasmic protein LptA [Pseudomonadota bacterium]NBX85792.1 lipopolysaccharide transport periplasmic protein LptA [Pseudomonadota bacterium]